MIFINQNVSYQRYENGAATEYGSWMSIFLAHLNDSGVDMANEEVFLTAESYTRKVTVDMADSLDPGYSLTEY